MESGTAAVPPAAAPVVGSGPTTTSTAMDTSSSTPQQPTNATNSSTVTPAPAVPDPVAAATAAAAAAAAASTSAAASALASTLLLENSPLSAYAAAYMSAMSAAQAQATLAAQAAAAQATLDAAKGKKAPASATKGGRKKKDEIGSAKKRKADGEDAEDDKRVKLEGGLVAAGGAAAAGAASSAAAAAASCRYDSSLGLLTKKFVQLLQEASNHGVLDLNQAATKLGVQKRRIYDITNVLEGIGLISKKSKNNIQWRGSGLGPMIDLRRELVGLKEELEGLLSEESQLDDYIRQMQETLQHTQEYESNASYCYMTHEDIRQVQHFADKIIIAIKAPKGTTLEVPDNGVKTDDKGKDTKKHIKANSEAQEPPSWQCILRSAGGPIDVYVVSNHENDNTQIGSDGQEYSTFDPSAANSPMHPPVSPIISSHTAANLTSHLSSVPNSPLNYNDASHPHHSSESVGAQSPFNLHHHLASPSHSNLFHATTPNHHQAIGAGAASPMPSDHAPSHSPAAISGLHTSRLGSPSMRYPPPAYHNTSTNYSPSFHQTNPSPYRTMSAAHSSPYPAGSQPSGSPLIKLEAPSNDPDYFMALDGSDLGLSDLYGGRADTIPAATTGTNRGVSDGITKSNSNGSATGSTSQWPEDSDNIFASPPAAK